MLFPLSATGEPQTAAQEPQTAPQEAQAAPEEPPADGCRVTPSIGCEWGEHSVDLFLSTRLRAEYWRARTSKSDIFYAARTRVGLKYSYGNLLTLFGEFQDARLYSLSPNSSGIAGVYRRFSRGKSDVDSQRIRQLYLDVKPIEGLGIRIGRQDINLGTEVMYPEANWKYVKIKRASQRLVGTVGWTHVERSNDAIRVSYDTGGHHLFGFAAQPTTGVFDVRDAYKQQSDINYGGLTWTVKRDTWLPNTELRLFGLVYDDKRSPGDGGLPDSVTVYTGGASVIGLYPLGPGTADVLAWGAYQFGSFNRLDHSAGAAILEGGYQFTEAPLKPWFRLGVNYASGDGDPTDGDHQTFFNMLPTNHLYYGYVDQLAFQNLINPFVQLKLKPHRRLNFDVTWHYFKLATNDDAKYVGTGAFNKDSFGYVVRPSGGQSDVGHEIDVTGVLKVHDHVELQAGYAHLFGGDVLSGPETRDTEWAFAQVLLTY